jgi:hypothetical protein
MLIANGTTIRTGELGEAMIRAARDRQLTRSEIIQLCNYEGFPQPFISLWRVARPIAKRRAGPLTFFITNAQ